MNDVSSQPWWKGTRGEWYVAVQFLLLGLVAVAPALPIVPSPWSLPWGLAARIVGFLLGAGGAAIAVAGSVALGPNLSVFPRPKDDVALVETGPYRLVRHPIYSGLCLGCFGWALLTNSVLALVLAVATLFFFDMKARREERWLAAKLPQYEAYSRRVRKLIPFIY